MTIDQYAPCPGGTGKKIKFCCPDLVNELEKVQRMLDGDQRAGCLDYIEGLQAKFPDRACLLSVKTMLEAQLGRGEAATATLNAFMEKYPDNPVALAELATIKASNGGGRAGVEPLQRAIQACGNQIPPQVYDAIGAVAQLLLAQGEILGARGHWMLQLGVQGTDEKVPMTFLARLNESPGIPLLLKQELPLVEAPPDALWKGSFAGSMQHAAHGAWLTAVESLEKLAAKAGDWPAIWQNIATLRAWMADTPGAVKALRKFASQDVPLDDAVEAEALAQLLDPAAADEIDVLTITYPINDVDKLTARLTASSQSPRIPMDLARLGSETEPPPKSAHWLLDRAVPPTGVGIVQSDIPLVVGQVFVFGKQTDRPARLELVTYRTAALDTARRALESIAEDALGTSTGEEVTTQIPAIQHVLSWNWRLPDDTPPEHRDRLLSNARREAVLEKWPELPQRVFDGKSAREVAADPAYRTRMLASILRLELSTEEKAAEIDYNQLRRSLGLPTAESIDPWKVPLDSVPLARLARIDAMKLSDGDLRDAYLRADHYRHTRALQKLAREVVNRPNISGEDRAAAYGALAEMEADAGVAGGYIDKARELARAAGKSCGPWDVAELALRLTGGDAPQVDRLLEHIRENHLREPDVAQALYQLLAEAGLISRDGTAPAGPAPPAPAGIVMPGPEPSAQPESSIWTPGSQPAAAGKKSTIWTPD